MSDKAKDIADADIVLATFDNIKGIPGEPIRGVVVQIGEKDDLTPAHASAAAKAMVDARQAYPDATLSLSLDGFDDDTREIWDIPEARTYVQRVITAVVDSYGADTVSRLNVDEPSYVLVGLCLGTLRVVGRDPTTGNYLLESDHGV